MIKKAHDVAKYFLHGVIKIDKVTSFMLANQNDTHLS